MGLIAPSPLEERLFDRLAAITDSRAEAKARRQSVNYQKWSARENELRSTLALMGYTNGQVDELHMEARGRLALQKGTLFSVEVSAAGNRVRLQWSRETAKKTGEKLAESYLKDDSPVNLQVIRQNVENVYDGATLENFLAYCDGFRQACDYRASRAHNLAERISAWRRALLR